MSTERAQQLEHLQLAVELSGIGVRELVLPDEYDVVAHKMRLHYLDWGTRGKRPILFLHGGALNAHTWDVVCLALCEQYHCLAMDQRGHGDSEWSPEADYSAEAHFGDIEGVVDQLGLDRFILVGQSLGALNAITYAARHPHRSAALVVIDAGPEFHIAGGQRIIDFVAQTAEIDSLDEFVEQALAFNPRRDRRLLRRSAQYNLRQLPNGKWARKCDVRHRPKTNAREMAARARELWKEIPRISCPTLVVRGGLSDLFHDADATKLAHALLDGRWVRVEDAGHTVQGDNPRGLVEVLREFFGAVGLSPA